MVERISTSRAVGFSWSICQACWGVNSLGCCGSVMALVPLVLGLFSVIFLV